MEEESPEHIKDAVFWLHPGALLHAFESFRRIPMGVHCGLT